MTEKTYINTQKPICPLCDFEYSDQLVTQNACVHCGNCGNVFDVTITRTSTGKRIQSEGQSIGHDEILLSFSTTAHNDPSPVDMSQIASYHDALKLYDERKISAQQLQQIVEAHNDSMSLDALFVDGWFGTDGKPKHLAKDRNPFNPEGDNRSREHGQGYNPNKHPRGILYQSHVKLIIRKMINLVYGGSCALYGRNRANALKRWIINRTVSSLPKTIDYLNSTITTKYDPDAFVFEDPFLVALRELGRKHIQTYFQWEQNTEEPIIKILDISLNLCKEDMPYRTLFKNFLNELIMTYPNGFELTPAETKHLQRIIARIEWNKSRK